MAVFNRDAAIVESRLLGIQRVARRMEAESGGAAGAAASAFTSMANAVTTAAVVVGGAVALAGAASIKFAADFEQSMALTQALTGATDKEMEGLETSITSLARVGTLGMGDLSKAATELGRAGVTIPDIMGGALKAVQDLTIASGGEIGLAAAAKLTATSMNAFGLTVEEIDRVTTAATVVAQNSALTFTDFGTAVQYSAPAFSAAGFTIEDLALATALLGKNGVTGSVAATSLRGVIQRLIRPSNDAQKVMDQYGISLFDSAGKARGMDEVMQQLHNAFSDEAVAAGKLTEEQRLQAISTLGLQRTGAAFLILANATTDEIAELRGSFERLQVTKLVDQLLKPLNAQMGIAWNNVQVLAYAFGKTFVDALAAPARDLVAFLQGLKEADFSALGQQVIDFGRAMLDAFANAIQQVREFVDAFGLAEPAMELFKNIALGLGAIIAGNIVAAIASAVLSMGGFLLAVGLITTGILKLIDHLDKAGVKLPTIGEILDAIGKKLSELGEAWAPWAAEAGVAGELVTQALIAVSGIVEALQFTLQGNYVAAAESAAKATGHFGEAGQHALTIITPLINLVVNLTKFLWEHKEAVLAVIAAFALWQVAGVIAGVLTSIGAALTVLTGIITTSIGVIGAIVAVLGGPLTIAIIAIIAVVALLTAAWSNNWGDIQGKTAAVVAGIGGFFNQLGSEMRIVQAGIVALGQVIGQAWEMLLSKTQGTWLGIRTAVQEAMIALDTAITGGWNTITSTISNALSTIVSTVSDAWNGVVTAISGALATAIGAVTTWVGQVVGIIRGLAGQLLAAGTDAGRAVVQGLTGAITNGIAEVGRAATALAQGVLNSARAALDARSPSKKFQQLGEDVDEGFEQGIEENSYDVVEAATQIVADLEYAVVARLEAAKRPIRGTAAGLVDDLVGEMYSIIGQIDQLGSDMQAKMTDIGEEVGRKINETIIEAAKSIEDVIEDTNDRIQDMLDNLARAREERGLRSGLSDSQEARRREQKDAQDERKRLRKERQEDEDAAKDALKSKAELERDHAKSLSDNELKRSRDLNEAKVDLEDSLQDATDDKQRAAALERYNDRRADIEREFSEKIQDIARDFELDKAALEDKLKEEAEQRAGRRQRQQQDADFERALELETNTLERQLEQETQDFNDKLEDEGLARSIARAEKERDKRIQSINEAMDEKQRKIREQGEREIQDLHENTLRKIDILEKEFAQKAADVLKKGGEQMRPLVDNIQEILSGNFAAMRKSAESFTESVNNAIGALKRLREERERAEYEAPVLPSPTKGLGVENLPEFQKGGMVPGPWGKPMVAVVHGGEYITGLHTSAAKMLAQMSRQQPTPGDTYNLNLNASYSSYESPADIELDMRAMIAMARG